MSVNIYTNKTHDELMKFAQDHAETYMKNKPFPSNYYDNFLINNSASSTFKCKQLEIMADGVITFNNTIVHNYGIVDIYGTLLHNDTTIGEIKNFVGATITVWGGGELNMN